MLSHEPIEWPDEVELLADRLESDSAQRTLSREERALMDVDDTVPVLGSQDGLHGFWQGGVLAWLSITYPPTPSQASSQKPK